MKQKKGISTNETTKIFYSKNFKFEKNKHFSWKSNNPHQNQKQEK